MYLLEYSLIVFPAIFLMVFIYMMEPLKKEPKFLLLASFGLGMLSPLLSDIFSIIPEILRSVLTDVKDRFLADVLFRFFIIYGFCEELGKYIMLRVLTWKNKNFDCVFSGIVYAVFVSLGFAVLENFDYVSKYGISCAIDRMVTAIPGHACFAVYMGYYYSKSKEMALLGNFKKSREFTRSAIFVPALIHGLYDAFMPLAKYITVGPMYMVLYMVWYAGIGFMFIFTLIFLSKVAKNSRYQRHDNGNQGEAHIIKQAKELESHRE